MLDPFGAAHHLPRCATSVKASNTSVRGPSMIRDTTISRSASVCVSAPTAMRSLLLLFLHVLVELIEPFAPELFEANDPFVKRSKTPRIEAVEALLPRLADLHEPDLAQHAEVLRGARLRNAQRARQFVDRALAPF